MAPQEWDVRVASATAPDTNGTAVDDMLTYLQRSPRLVGPVLGVEDGRLTLTCQVADQDGRGAVHAIVLAWQELLDACAAAQVQTAGGWYAAEAHAVPYTGDDT